MPTTFDPNEPLPPSVVEALEQAGVDPSTSSWAQAINVLGAQTLAEILGQPTAPTDPSNEPAVVAEPVPTEQAATDPVTSEAQRTEPPKVPPSSTFTCPSCGRLLIVEAP
jgi:hypothetical protein